MRCDPELVELLCCPRCQGGLDVLTKSEIREDGQFDIVNASEGLVSPDSYSAYLWPDGDFPAPTGGPKK